MKKTIKAFFKIIGSFSPVLLYLPITAWLV